MDRALEIVLAFIDEYAACPPSYGDVETEVIVDSERGHYALMFQGWNGPRRVYGTVIHVDIKNDKLYIQHDGTEESLANRLIEGGISPDRIVLCYHPPRIRPETKFAVA